MKREVPEGRVSRNAKTASDPTKWKSSRMARFQETDFGVSCYCGAAKRHNSAKVRGRWATKHQDKYHQGRGIWL